MLTSISRYRTGNELNELQSFRTILRGVAPFIMYCYRTMESTLKLVFIYTTTVIWSVTVFFFKFRHHIRSTGLINLNPLLCQVELARLFCRWNNITIELMFLWPIQISSWLLKFESLKISFTFTIHINYSNDKVFLFLVSMFRARFRKMVIFFVSFGLPKVIS